jgi:hypothetical protein
LDRLARQFPAISGSRISWSPDFVDGHCDQSTLIVWSPERPLDGQPPVDHYHCAHATSAWALSFLLSSKRIEIDELRIVLMGIALESSAAMNVHQGLHTPGI